MDSWIKRILRKKKKIRGELLAYCERDTRAMVEIHKVLEDLCKTS
jgi:hypothetical protein